MSLDVPCLSQSRVWCCMGWVLEHQQPNPVVRFIVVYSVLPSQAVAASSVMVHTQPQSRKSLVGVRVEVAGGCCLALAQSCMRVSAQCSHPILWGCIWLAISPFGEGTEGVSMLIHFRATREVWRVGCVLCCSAYCSPDCGKRCWPCCLCVCVRVWLCVSVWLRAWVEAATTFLLHAIPCVVWHTMPIVFCMRCVLIGPCGH